MIEFLTNYGLWIALAGVFLVMHKFGMSCCGGTHRHGPAGRSEGTTGKTPDKEGVPEERRNS